MPYFPPPTSGSGSGTPPLVVFANTTYTVSNNQQPIARVPMIFQTNAMIQREGTGILLVLR